MASRQLAIGLTVFVDGVREGVLACEDAAAGKWDVLLEDGSDEHGVAAERIALSPSSLRVEKPILSVKPIPRRAFEVDPTRAWDIVRSVRGDARKLAIDDFCGEKLPPKRDGTLRFVCISDTHSYESKTMSMSTALESIPDGDVLLHCGDFTNTGKLAEVSAFAQWFGKLPHARKILIAGNHDLALDEASYAETARRFGHGAQTDVAGTCAKARALLEAIPNCEYLEDEDTEVEGIRIWGSPWQPEFCDWAFNLPRGEACREVWRRIPADVNVLLTHGPPLGHGDLCSSGMRAGCLDLLDEVQLRVRPRYHCFGHIHEAHGVTTDGQTTYVNASTCNMRYRPINEAIVFDIELPQRLAAAGVTAAAGATLEHAAVPMGGKGGEAREAGENEGGACGGGGEGGCCGGVRRPQSTQSVPNAQDVNSAPSPPSSQSPSRCVLA